MPALNEKLELALARHRAGELQAATELYRAILAEAPDHPDSLHMLGLIAQQRGNPELALKLIEAALAKKPDLAIAWCNRCLILRVLNRHEEALQSARQAIQIDPSLADGWDMAGSILRSMQKLDDARDYLHRAVTLQPENIRFQSNYAGLLLGMGDLLGAHRAVRETKRLDPQFVPFTLANVLKAAGYPKKAIPHFQRTYEILPDYSEALVNEAMALLQIGDLERGLRLWEQRADMDTKLQQLPSWGGERISHLILYEDQGLGDILQCLRYIPLVRQRVSKLTVRVSSLLKRLIEFNFPDVTVLLYDAPIPNADARIRMMSLPFVFETRLDRLPSMQAYLRSNKAWRDAWRSDRSFTLPTEKPRLGVVWSGNPDNRNDRNRSVGFAAYASLLQLARGHAVSLQKGPQRAEAEFVKFDLVDAAPLLEDFADTAGLIEELDLVITVDTAVAHLAGAMGKPVWMLIPFDNDWRWLIAREDSPWYPTMRLFRQTEPGAWGPVIERVAADLRRFLDGDTAVLQPTPWVGPPCRENPHAVRLEEI